MILFRANVGSRGRPGRHDAQPAGDPPPARPARSAAGDDRSGGRAGEAPQRRAPALARTAGTHRQRRAGPLGGRRHGSQPAWRRGQRQPGSGARRRAPRLLPAAQPALLLVRPGSRGSPRLGVRGRAAGRRRGGARSSTSPGWAPWAATRTTPCNACACRWAPCGHRPGAVRRRHPRRGTPGHDQLGRLLAIRSRCPAPSRPLWCRASCARGWASAA